MRLVPNVVGHQFHVGDIVKSVQVAGPVIRVGRAVAVSHQTAGEIRGPPVGEVQEAGLGQARPQPALAGDEQLRKIPMPRRDLR